MPSSKRLFINFICIVTVIVLFEWGGNLKVVSALQYDPVPIVIFDEQEVKKFHLPDTLKKSHVSLKHNNSLTNNSLTNNSLSNNSLINNSLSNSSHGNNSLSNNSTLSSKNISNLSDPKHLKERTSSHADICADGECYPSLEHYENYNVSKTSAPVNSETQETFWIPEWDLDYFSAGNSSATRTLLNISEANSPPLLNKSNDTSNESESKPSRNGNDDIPIKIFMTQLMQKKKKKEKHLKLQQAKGKQTLSKSSTPKTNKLEQENRTTTPVANVTGQNPLKTNVTARNKQHPKTTIVNVTDAERTSTLNLDVTSGGHKVSAANINEHPEQITESPQSINDSTEERSMPSHLNDPEEQKNISSNVTGQSLLIANANEQRSTSPRLNERDDDKTDVNESFQLSSMSPHLNDSAPEKTTASNVNEPDGQETEIPNLNEFTQQKSVTTTVNTTSPQRPVEATVTELVEHIPSRRKGNKHGKERASLGESMQNTSLSANVSGHEDQLSLATNANDSAEQEESVEPIFNERDNDKLESVNIPIGNLSKQGFAPPTVNITNQHNALSSSVNNRTTQKNLVSSTYNNTTQQRSTPSSINDTVLPSTNDTTSSSMNDTMSPFINETMTPPINDTESPLYNNDTVASLYTNGTVSPSINESMLSIGINTTEDGLVASTLNDSTPQRSIPPTVNEREKEKTETSTVIDSPRQKPIDSEPGQQRSLTPRVNHLAGQRSPTPNKPNITNITQLKSYTNKNSMQSSSWNNNASRKLTNGSNKIQIESFYHSAKPKYPTISSPSTSKKDTLSTGIPSIKGVIQKGFTTPQLKEIKGVSIANINTQTVFDNTRDELDQPIISKPESIYPETVSIQPDKILPHQPTARAFYIPKQSPGGLRSIMHIPIRAAVNFPIVKARIENINQSGLIHSSIITKSHPPSLNKRYMNIENVRFYQPLEKSVKKTNNIPPKIKVNNNLKNSDRDNYKSILTNRHGVNPKNQPTRQPGLKSDKALRKQSNAITPNQTIPKAKVVKLEKQKANNTHIKTHPIVPIPHKRKLVVTPALIKKLSRSLKRNILDVWPYPKYIKTPADAMLDQGLINRAKLQISSGRRLDNFFKRAIHGENIKIAYISSSLFRKLSVETRKAHILLYNQAFLYWFHKVISPITGSKLSEVKVEIPDVKEDYFSRCLKNHLAHPEDINLIIWELAEMDHKPSGKLIPSNGTYTETLIRNTLKYSSQPELIMVDFFRGSKLNKGDYCQQLNQDMETKLAAHYDCTFLSWSKSICPYLRDDEEGFSYSYLFSGDKLHPSIIGHAQMAYILVDYLRDEFLKYLSLHSNKYSEYKDFISKPLALPKSMYSDVHQTLCYTSLRSLGNTMDASNAPLSVMFIKPKEVKNADQRSSIAPNMDSKQVRSIIFRFSIPGRPDEIRNTTLGIMPYFSKPLLTVARVDNQPFMKLNTRKVTKGKILEIQPITRLSNGNHMIRFYSLDKRFNVLAFTVDEKQKLL